jgi:predicted nucleic acid-binding protein
MTDIVVCDTGPLISLEKMRDGYGFIRKLYKKIIVPPSVLHEASLGICSSPQEYLRSFKVEDLIETVKPSLTIKIPGIERLGTGEAEAISLALQFKYPLLIEETLGRKIAVSAGLKVSGIAGQLVKAFKLGILDKMETNRKLEELFAGGRINQEILKALLTR